ncbi:hypothetical protein MSPP1_002997 [Malassezia sp. CBS 17886]|nr:hypothetical protein MSPP1_002997 [Malassezia sp. CBS 17886]
MSEAFPNPFDPPAAPAQAPTDDEDELARALRESLAVQREEDSRHQARERAEIQTAIAASEAEAQRRPMDESQSLQDVLESSRMEALRDSQRRESERQRLTRLEREVMEQSRREHEGRQSSGTQHMHGAPRWPADARSPELRLSAPGPEGSHRRGAAADSAAERDCTRGDGGIGRGRARTGADASAPTTASAPPAQQAAADDAPHHALLDLDEVPSVPPPSYTAHVAQADGARGGAAPPSTGLPTRASGSVREYAAAPALGTLPPAAALHAQARQPTPPASLEAARADDVMPNPHARADAGRAAGTGQPHPAVRAGARPSPPAQTHAPLPAHAQPCRPADVQQSLGAAGHARAAPPCISRTIMQPGAPDPMHVTQPMGSAAEPPDETCPAAPESMQRMPGAMPDALGPSAARREDEDASSSTDTVYPPENINGQPALRGVQFGWTPDPLEPALYVTNRSARVLFARPLVHEPPALPPAGGAGEGELELYFPDTVELPGAGEGTSPWFVLRTYSWKVLLKAIAWYGKTTISCTGAESKLHMELAFSVPRRVDSYNPAFARGTPEDGGGTMPSFASVAMARADVAPPPASTRSLEAFSISHNAACTTVSLQVHPIALPTTLVTLAQTLHSAPHLSSAPALRELRQVIARQDEWLESRRSVLTQRAGRTGSADTLELALLNNQLSLLSQAHIASAPADEEPHGARDHLRQRVRKTFARWNGGATSSEDLASWITPFDVASHQPGGGGVGEGEGG